MDDSNEDETEPTSGLEIAAWGGAAFGAMWLIAVLTRLFG